MLKLFIAIASVFAVSAFADDVNNGSDLRGPDDGAAWFLNKNQPVRYCIDVDFRFGVDEAAISRDITDAIAMWSRYISERNINVRSDKVTFANRFVLEPCQSGTELTFYFGGKNSRIDAGKQKLGLKNPIAFAYRESYDAHNMRAKGIIWISERSSPNKPNWRTPFALKTILTHELGHVYGIGHINGTIMRDDIADVLLYNTRLTPPAIDAARELIACFGCDQKVDANASDKDYEWMGLEEKFERFVGQPANGRVIATLLQEASNDVASGFSLILRDKIQSVKLPIILDLKALNHHYRGGGLVFKNYFCQKDGPHETCGSSTHKYGDIGMILHGKLYDLKGSSYELTLLRNMDKARYQLYLIESNKQVPLFIAGANDSR